MRIIAGKFKAKKINGPKTKDTRPTLDRVKEALFSIIDKKIQDARVLDLFSGTGNLGLESISRGAKFALLNDSKPASISTIIQNVKLTCASLYVKISKKDYIKCLNQIIKDNETFDVIFLDPPYDSNLGINSLKFISDNKNKVLSKDGIIIYETDKNFILKLKKKATETVLDDFGNLECYDKRHYGNVVLRLYRWRE